MTNTTASLGGNLYARKEQAPGEYLTLFGSLGQSGRLSLSDQQAWELLQILLSDIERLAATQPAATLDNEQQQIIALHQVYKALEYSDQSVEDLAWSGDPEETSAIVDQASVAAEQMRKEVDSWQEPILTLISAVEDAALLRADIEIEQKAEQKTSQGGTLFDLVVDTILKNTDRMPADKSPDENETTGL